MSARQQWEGGGDQKKKKKEDEIGCSEEAAVSPFITTSRDLPNTAAVENAPTQGGIQSPSSQRWR